MPTPGRDITCRSTPRPCSGGETRTLLPLLIMSIAPPSAAAIEDPYRNAAAFESAGDRPPPQLPSATAAVGVASKRATVASPPRAATTRLVISFFMSPLLRSAQ